MTPHNYLLSAKNDHFSPELGFRTKIMYNISMIRISELRNRRFLSLFGIGAILALLVSTLQVPVSTHWCGGKVFNRGVYTEAAPCAMDAPMVDPAKSVSAVPCCSNEIALLAASGLDFDSQTSNLQDLSKTLQFASLEQFGQPFLTTMDRSSLNGLPQGPPGRSTPALFDLYQSYLI